jgi:FkbM family methyltransferase
MVSRKGQIVAAIAALCLLGVIAVPTALDRFRPSEGYRRVVARWINPQTAPDVGIEEVIRRRANFVVDIEEVIRRQANFVVDIYGFRYQGNTGNRVDAYIYYYGAYEKSELSLVREILTFLTPRPVMIDVGANTGLYSLFASKYAKEVHAIEPFPPILSRLRAHIADNKIGNIVVHPVGLGEAEAELPFYSPPEANLGTGSFVVGFKSENRDEKLTLKVVAGDMYLPKVGITRVDFIKMDIEGYEKQALAGLRETLRRQRPIVLMEITIDPAFPHFFKSMEELRVAFPENYEFFVLADRNPLTGAFQLEPFDPPFDRSLQFNIVARPAEKANAVPMKFDGEAANR